MISPEDFPPDRPFSVEKKRALQASFVGSAPQRRPRRRLRITLASAGTAIVLGGGGAIAYSAIATNSVTDESSARCYSVASYSSKGGDDFPGTSISAVDAGDAPGRVTSAIDVCASLWRAGFLQAGVTGQVRNPTQATYPVPALVGCVMANGQAAVFPGTAAICSQFGLVAIASRPASS